MTIDNAVSGSERSDAGADDAFSKAFDAAVESTQVEDDAYAPDAKVGQGETKPVVSDSTENAAEPKVGKEKAPKVEASKEPATDIAAPAHWDAKRREAFGALTSPSAKQAMLELTKGLEEEFLRKTTEAADETKFARNIKSLISDTHRSQLRSAGMDEVAGIQHLLRLNDFATAKPDEYARWLFSQTGLDPRDVFPEYFAGQGGEQAQYQQPAHQAGPSEETLRLLQSLQSKVEGIEQTAQQQTYRQADRAIDRFRTEVDEGGQPKHPHFARVESAMTDLLVTPKYQAIEDFSERLAKAYDVAVLMDPDIRTQIVDGQVQTRLADQKKADDIAKARRAAAPIRSAPTGAPKGKPGTIDDALSNAMSTLGV